MFKGGFHSGMYLKRQLLNGLEPVPGDFSMKNTGMEIISKNVSLPQFSFGLEVGCGSGFNSALLSQYGKKLVATDLPYYDANTHSLGISVAKKLFSEFKIENVKLLSCSGEELPFKDDTFDFIFSSSVLEHIEDKDKALKEMFRVCKRGGIVIFIIPTFVQSICAFVHLYLYAARRAIDVAETKIFRKHVRSKETLLPKGDDLMRSSSDIVGSFWSNHPSFPLPEPHGSYDNVFHEFVEQLPWNWVRLAKKCGASSVRSFAFMFLPFNILEVFSTKLIAYLYSMTKNIHIVLGRTFLKYFSYSLCVVGRK